MDKSCGAHKVISESPASPSSLNTGLFSLPFELREQIWKLVLDDSPVFEILPRSKDQFSYFYDHLGPDAAGATGPWKPAQYSALVHTSRQVRDEVLPLFYKRTIFDAPHHLMLQFLGSIGRENVELIMRVRHSHHVGGNAPVNTLSDAYYGLFGLRRDALEVPIRQSKEGTLLWVNNRTRHHWEWSSSMRDGSGGPFLVYMGEGVEAQAERCWGCGVRGMGGWCFWCRHPNEVVQLV